MRRPGGFTLIEVLVALAILAAVLYAGSVSVRSAARQQEARELTLLSHWTAADAATAILLEPRDTPEAVPTVPPPREVLMDGRRFRVSFALLEEQLPESLRAAGVSETRALRRMVVEVSAAQKPEAVLQHLEVPLP